MPESDPFIIDPNATSWVESAQGSDFPIQNLPYGKFLHRPYGGTKVSGFAIGDYLMCLERAQFSPSAPLLKNQKGKSFRDMRRLAYQILSAESTPDPEILIPLSELEPHRRLIPSYVDFYAGIHHASNVGKMFRPTQEPLLPNYRHVPIGYNGRASTVVPSGTPIIRPKGQLKPAEGDPIFAPTRELDIELELGFILDRGTELGEVLPIDQAEEAIKGICLVNDWSARDIQRWEYQPLGPFLAKTFATSISPWIVSLDALHACRIAGMAQDPAPLPYLQHGPKPHFDIHLEIWIQSAKMTKPQRICQSNAKYLYWSMAQQLAHQSSNGTQLVANDLYATGTISGPEKGTYGSLLELTWRGEEPITLEETGETRTFLEDGDTVIMKGWADGPGYRIGLGEVVGTIQPAI